jgi:hypothetical protein
MIVRIFAAVLLVCVLDGCRSQGPAPSAGGASSTAADSIVLERTRCYGTCPAYRLSLARSGAIHFQSLNPGDSARVGTGTLAPGAFDALVAEAARIGFAGLPERISGSPLCGQQTTDSPSAYVTIFGGGGAKRVEDYHGCRGVPPELRRFEVAIDSAAGSSRWVRQIGIR